MSSILFGGLFFERKVFVLNSLAAAAFFLLCWKTNELFSTGFQLSFAVVGAIILFADPFAGFLQRWTAPDPFLPRSLLRGPRYWLHAGFEWLCRGTGVSLAAWLGSLPLVLWYFYIVTPISLVANLIVVPIAFFILAIALLSLLSTPLLSGLAVIFNNANWLLVRVVMGIVQFLAQVPGGHFYVEHPHWPEKLVAKITVLDVDAGAAVHLQAGSANWLFESHPIRIVDSQLLMQASCESITGEHNKYTEIRQYSPTYYDGQTPRVSRNGNRRNHDQHRVREDYSERPAQPGGQETVSLSVNAVLRALMNEVD